MRQKRKLTNTHKAAIRHGVITYHDKCKRCLSNKKKIYKFPSNNKRTKRIAELFERQKLRKQRLAAIEARMNMVAKLTKKKS